MGREFGLRATLQIGEYKLERIATSITRSLGRTVTSAKWIKDEHAR